MTPTKKKILLMAWLTAMFALIGHASATHISQPILIDPRTEYSVGEPVILQGRVDYNEQPAPDVLLNFKLVHADGTVVADQSFSSDRDGRFEFRFDTANVASGSYQFTVTSHCLEEHRYACTYKNKTLSIHLK